MLINLLAQPCVLLSTDGSVYTVPPSGIIARIVEDLSPGTVDSWLTADDTHTPPVRVRQPSSVNPPTFEGIPKEPNDYIVPAQICAEMARQFVTLPKGVRLLTPEMLIFPGQPGHPGGAVKTPVAPGLVLRYAKGVWLG